MKGRETAQQLLLQTKKKDLEKITLLPITNVTANLDSGKREEEH